MLKGKKLTSASTIGIIAPASPENKDKIDKKLCEFKELGFKIKLAPHLYNKYGHLAGFDSDRIKDLHDMFLDPSIDGIVCLRGGYGTARLISSLDKKIILQNPKFFCGYSDITLLLNYFANLGLITFHGPMITSDFTDELTKKYFLKTSICNTKNFSYDLLDLNPNISTYNLSSFKGKLVGGNLSIICSSLSTKYEINTKDSILLIEEVNEAPYCIDRMLTHLINSGKLHDCNGIIIGHLTDCTLPNYDRSLTTEEVILNRLLPLNIPLIIGMPFGHSCPNITIPIGASAYFNNKIMKLTIKDNFLL